MNRFKGFFLLSFGIFLLIGAPVSGSVRSMKSPSGRITVQFVQMSRKELNHEADGDFETEFDIIFLRNRKPIAHAPFLYTSFGKEESILELFRHFTWSPKEKYVFLPYEYSGCTSACTDPRSVVALDPHLTWGSVEIRFDIFSWGDDLTVYGTQTGQDAPFSVFEFDARNGKEKKLFEFEGNLGIYLLDFKDGEFLIQKSIPGAEGVQCGLYDFHGVNLRTVPCPKGE